MFSFEKQRDKTEEGQGLCIYKQLYRLNHSQNTSYITYNKFSFDQNLRFYNNFATQFYSSKLEIKLTIIIKSELEMSANKMALLKRKEKDVYKLRSSKFLVQETQNESTYQVEFCGPQNTAYELGKWKINLYLPEQYPYKSPSVGFINRIYHPNIDFTSGSVCLDVINQTWTPMYELLNIFEIFLPQLLTYPNPASPLNQQAAQLYEEDLQKYNEKVKEFINKYALNNELVKQRKKSEDVLKEAEKEAEKVVINIGEEQHSMDDQGSSMSERNQMEVDQDLRLY